MSARERILAALPDSAGGTAPSAISTLDSGSFEQAIVRAGATICALEQLDLEGKRVYVDEDARAHAGHNCDDVWSAEVGVTLCDFAIAQLGTLVVSESASRNRLTSLAPPTHVALVQKDKIVSTLEDCMDRIPSATCALITGPSSTRDIEGIAVQGVHGPGELIVVVLD
jgi:L-lactate utilization protein LutC